MKNIAVSAHLVAFLLFASLATAGTPDPAPICGDVNESGSVNTSDALLVLKKGVGQSVTLDCSAYDDRFSQCETALSAANADLVACSTGSRCGDGIVNSVGEHCDDEDLAGADCASLGHGTGTLGCDENCKFDTDGCDFCPDGSYSFQGACWLLGAVPSGEGVGSCDAACASIGRECDEPALQFVGSAGSDSTCQVAADAADPADAPHAISSAPPFATTACGPATDYAAGCLLAEGLAPPDINGSWRTTYAGSGTLCEADYYGGPCGTPARRICACKP